VTLRKWFYLFWTSLAIGAAAGMITGLLMQIFDQDVVLSGKALGFNAFTSLLGGATISVLSQMGFFAYLIVRYMVGGMFRKKWIWNYIQIVLMLIVIFDLVYLRFANADNPGALGSYLILPLVMIAVGVAIAWYKVKLTNPSAWIPTLFFMIFVSALEAIPSIRENNPASTIFMMTPLLACNAWQILVLHKVLDANKEPQ